MNLKLERLYSKLRTYENLKKDICSVQQNTSSYVQIKDLY